MRLTPLVLLASVALASLQTPARAQVEVPKLQPLCPLGYVESPNGRCTSLGRIPYTLEPNRGQPCREGWLNVGGGYCRRK
jgi:hypothetical protein